MFCDLKILVNAIFEDVNLCIGYIDLHLHVLNLILIVVVIALQHSLQLLDVSLISLFDILDVNFLLKALILDFFLLSLILFEHLGVV